MSTAFRILLALAAASIALAFLLGPAWRGSFYRSWLRPRLVALGILLVIFAIGEYAYRLLTAIRKH
ncbi:MAG TPA: hypothetical protein VFR68_13040 [Candidatus Dormibacteraeota bacterium]|nr:hypothetical protein [Candidatus Dormibacteraeota bacterium]